MKEKIKIEKIRFEGKNITDFGPSDINVERIEFFVEDEKFVITPDFGSFRIHKSFGDRISINPGCSNEILIS